jgi:hypothetical protein
VKNFNQSFLVTKPIEMFIRSVSRVIHNIRIVSFELRSSLSLIFPSSRFGGGSVQLIPLHDGIFADDAHENNQQSDLISLLNEYILKAAPKSKVEAHTPTPAS